MFSIKLNELKGIKELQFVVPEQNKIMYILSQDLTVVEKPVYLSHLAECVIQMLLLRVIELLDMISMRIQRLPMIIMVQPFLIQKMTNAGQSHPKRGKEHTSSFPLQSCQLLNN